MTVKFGLARKLRRIVLFGLGDVSKKVHDAILQLKREGLIDDALYVDVNSKTFAKFREDGIRCSVLKRTEDAPELLRMEKFYGDDVLAVICAPDRYHVQYAEVLAGVVGHTALEKPLALSVEEARRLLKLGDSCSAIEHQLCKLESLQLKQKLATKEIKYTDISRMQFSMLEALAVGDRELPPLAFDTGYHGLALAIAALRRQVEHVEYQVEECFVATYDNGPDVPKNSTAALIRGQIIAEWHNIRFEVKVAKGVASTEKEFCLFTDIANHKISLNEGGYEPHGRVIRGALKGDPPIISIRDSIEVVAACEAAVSIAVDCGFYEFGTAINWSKLIAQSRKAA